MVVAVEEPEEDRGFLAKGPAEGDGFSLVGEERRSGRRGRVQVAAGLFGRGRGRVGGDGYRR